MTSRSVLCLFALLSACQIGGNVAGKVVDPMTGQPRANLRIIAKANPESPDPQCQMKDATTGADGSFTIQGTCPNTSYDLVLKDETLMIAGEAKAAGGSPVGPLTLDAWRAPASTGVFLLKGDKLTSVKTAADVDKETITGTTEQVWYPTMTPAKVTLIDAGSYLVISGKDLVDGLNFAPLVVHPGKVRFSTGADTYVDIPDQGFIGTTFTSDTEFQRVAATPDTAKAKEVMRGDKSMRYYAADSLPAGRYVLMRNGDKRVYIFDFGTASAAPAAMADAAAAAPAAEGQMADGAAPAADGAAVEAKNEPAEKAPQ
jgi:hypothetical protein